MKSHFENDTLRLTILPSHLMAARAYEIHLKLTDLLENPDFYHARSVVLDVTQVQAIDSMGIKAVIELYKACQLHRKVFSVEVAPHPVAQALHHCRLDRIITVREVAERV